jgi:hypothetical protein
MNAPGEFLCHRKTGRKAYWIVASQKRGTRSSALLRGQCHLDPPHSHRESPGRCAPHEESHVRKAKGRGTQGAG